MEKRRPVPIYKNFFVVSFAIFSIWMVFFDTNSIMTNLYLQERYADLKRQKAYYQTGIEKLKKQVDDLQSNSRLAEKIAREKYHFKKPNEDVFLLPEK